MSVIKAMMVAERQPPFSHRARAELVDRLKRETFDLIVIGGGITGAGIARDAALRAFKTALVEARDFAGGTSSRSARLVHGGLRYIEMLQFGIVSQACAERRILTSIAPQLVEPLLITMPIYRKRNRYYKVWLGMWLYDMLAGYQNTHTFEKINARQLAQREPAMCTDDLLGAFQYYDRTTDDARMTLITILSAYERGALALNYAKAQALLKTQRRVSGIAVRDYLSGETFEARAKLVVNATGAWNDAIRQMDGADSRASVRPNKGIHVIVLRERLPLRNGVDFPAKGVKRTMYATPWRHTCIIGTSDSDHTGDFDQVCADRAEVQITLDSVNQTFSNACLTFDDVLSTYSGVRPLVMVEGKNPYRMSREHKISVSPSGLISIVGGKFTTHRAMAQDVVDLAATRLNARAQCRTACVPLDEGINSIRDVESLVEQAQPAAHALSSGTAQHLASAYGSRCLDVLQLAGYDQHLQQPFIEGLPYLWAEIPYAIENEMALTLNDVMIRRLHLIHGDKAQGLAHADAIAQMMGTYLRWTPEEMSRQVAAYQHEVALARKFREE